MVLNHWLTCFGGLVFSLYLNLLLIDRDFLNFEDFLSYFLSQQFIEVKSVGNNIGWFSDGEFFFMTSWNDGILVLPPNLISLFDKSKDWECEREMEKLRKASWWIFFGILRKLKRMISKPFPYQWQKFQQNDNSRISENRKLTQRKLWVKILIQKRWDNVLFIRKVLDPLFVQTWPINPKLLCISIVSESSKFWVISHFLWVDWIFFTLDHRLVVCALDSNQIFIITIFAGKIRSQPLDQQFDWLKR